jgi:hypothetical protein
MLIDVILIILLANFEVDILGRNDVRLQVYLEGRSTREAATKQTISVLESATKAPPGTTCISASSEPLNFIPACKFCVFFVYNQARAQRYYKSLVFPSSATQIRHIFQLPGAFHPPTPRKQYF